MITDPPTTCFTTVSKNNKNKIKCHMTKQNSDHISKQFFLSNFFLLSTVNSTMSKNMCKLHHKVRNGNFYPMHVHISSISNLDFKIKLSLFHSRLSQTYSINPYLKKYTRGIHFWKLKTKKQKFNLKNRNWVF